MGIKINKTNNKLNHDFLRPQTSFGKVQITSSNQLAKGVAMSRNIRACTFYKSYIIVFEITYDGKDVISVYDAKSFQRTREVWVNGESVSGIFTSFRENFIALTCGAIREVTEVGHGTYESVYCKGADRFSFSNAGNDKGYIPIIADQSTIVMLKRRQHIEWANMFGQPICALARTANKQELIAVLGDGLRSHKISRITWLDAVNGDESQQSKPLDLLPGCPIVAINDIGTCIAWWDDRKEMKQISWQYTDRDSMEKPLLSADEGTFINGAEWWLDFAPSSAGNLLALAYNDAEDNSITRIKIVDLKQGLCLLERTFAIDPHESRYPRTAWEASGKRILINRSNTPVVQKEFHGTIIQI